MKLTRNSSKTNDALLLGGEPRVDLLPPEVRVERKAKSTRRALVYGALAIVLVVLVATGGATVLAVQSQSALATEQARTISLLAQQSKFIKVRQVQQQITLDKAAQQVGDSTEIDWQKYLNSVQATLPANVTINTVNIDSASPLETYAQSTAPLQGARVATLSFSASSPTLPEVPTWLTALASLPGFEDAIPGSVALDTTSNLYTANITMHINEAAFDKRFATKEK
jgi:Tfp pilus assembly protein PilN